MRCRFALAGRACEVKRMTKAQLELLIYLAEKLYESERSKKLFYDMTFDERDELLKFDRLIDAVKYEDVEER